MNSKGKILVADDEAPLRMLLDNELRRRVPLKVGAKR